MEKEKMLQILVPALAVAAIVVVFGLIVYSSAPPDDAKAGPGAVPPVAPGKKTIAEVPANTDGTSLTVPDVAAPEWRDLGDGLKAWDVKVGDGEGAVTESDDGLWHYTGWRPDGFIFDSSVRRNAPTAFNLGDVIKGWTRGLPGMKAGGIRRLYIPSALAYGSRGTGKDIPGNTDLIFEVKLLRITR